MSRFGDALALQIAEDRARLIEHAETHPGRIVDGGCAECVILAARCGVDLSRR